MLRRFLAREERFFTRFKDAAELTLQGAQELEKMLNDLGSAEIYAKRIQDLEDRADKVAHAVIELLHKTFITPIDREQIFLLVAKMDDILDLIEDAASRIWLYRLTDVSQEAKTMAALTTEAVRHILSIMTEMDHFQSAPTIAGSCVEINRIENAVDTLLRQSLASLFSDEKDLRNLIKLKEVYELLESITDRCEDVSNIVEGILLEYA